MESMTTAFVCVPPTMKKMSAPGQSQAARIFSFALSQYLSLP